jgi:hypothetical protein
MTGPVALMAAASFICWGALSLVMGPEGRSAVLLGSVGPLVAAVATWIVVERLHARKPDQVSNAMIKLLAAKMLFFGTYVASAVLLLQLPARAFVVSFTSQYIMLHFIEALLLRRLFAGPGGRVGVD